MYLRTDHAETHIPTLRKFIQDNPLGVITTALRSKSHPFIQSSHVPWLLDIQDESSETELGVLRGHMARANPQSKAIIESLSQAQHKNDKSEAQYLDGEVLVLFSSPAHSYVTPKFYLETKPSTSKVVPTWNYSAVQAYGRARIYYDAKSSATISYLAKQISDLTVMTETKIMGYDEPWSVEDAPAKYVELLRQAIIGVEVEITRLEGKFKMSQERPLADRNGVVDGFAGLETDLGRQISRTVREKGEEFDAKKSASRSKS